MAIDRHHSTRRSSRGTSAVARAAFALTLFASVATAAADTPTTPDDPVRRCLATYRPQAGQSGKNVIWLPTPDKLVADMLQLGRVRSDDIVFDLGAGDGKIPIAAARDFGATAKGIEFNPDLAQLAACFASAAGVGDRAKIVQGDVFQEDFSSATVVTMYLLPKLNLCLRHRLLAMSPGTRVVTHRFTMGEWEADETTAVDGNKTSRLDTAYLWIIPARVAGTWEITAGGDKFAVELSQWFQQIGGTATFQGATGPVSRPLVGASLRGTTLAIGGQDASGERWKLTAKVRSDRLEGTLQRGTSVVDVTASRTAAGRAPAPWAEMAPGCEDFYPASRKDGGATSTPSE